MPAQALTFHRRATQAIANEANDAEPLLVNHVIGVTPTSAAESDSAEALSVTTGLRTYKTLTPASESDTAEPVVFKRGVTLANVTGINSAEALGFTHVIGVTLTPVTEADSAQALVNSHIPRTFKTITWAPGG